MQRVLVLAEGQTEERFIKDVLCPHLWDRQIDLIPTIVVTKRVKSGPDFKGGITNYRRVESDLRKLLGDTDVAAVTTFVDYYGLPEDFPGMDSRPVASPALRAQHVESQWYSQIAHPRFHPFLMVHEFEALLFTNTAEIARAINMPGVDVALEGVKRGFQSPEEINETPGGSPSNRIISAAPGYRKVLHGPNITNRIGLDSIREQCPHFHSWMSWLENI